ncbi:hypothetical protein LCGC14_2900250, partial [marine sediment metagenome]
LLSVNKIETTEQAMECGSLWDTSNGRVLCRECHLNTSTWGFRSVSNQKKV